MNLQYGRKPPNSPWMDDKEPGHPEKHDDSCFTHNEQTSPPEYRVTITINGLGWIVWAIVSAAVMLAFAM